MSTLPESVKIGWTDYRIESWDHREAVGADRHGETSHTSSVIRVDQSYGARQTAATLLHEILHGVCRVWSIDREDSEESIVRKMEHGIATVWRDNPDVMKWIGAQFASEAAS